jgi:hypothetical protein
MKKGTNRPLAGQKTQKDVENDTKKLTEKLLAKLSVNPDGTKKP